MSKKILFTGTALIAVLLALSHPAAAQGQAQTQEDRDMHTSHSMSSNMSARDMWSNFYLGGFGGYGWVNADQDAGSTLDVNGTEYGVFAGYELGGLLNNSMNIGLNGALEFHYAWSNADDSGGGVTIEKNHEWGLSFRPGLALISDHMPLGLKPYGILGWRRASFSTTAGGGSNNYDGFELGIGAELVTAGNLGVRLDYAHVFYEDNNGIDPSENDLRLGLTYHF